MSFRIYLHSAHADFAQTEVLPREDDPASGPGLAARRPIRWLHCGCKQARLVRVRRSGWLRLVPLLRLYVCWACRARVLRTKTRSSFTYGPVYIPAPPLANRPDNVLRQLARLPPWALRR